MEKGERDAGQREQKCQSTEGGYSVRVVCVLEEGEKGA